MLSAPATIPATSATTFTSALDPAGPGTRTCARARSCSPPRPANVMTATSPAHDTRFGSSKPAETLWQDRIYRVSLCLVRWSRQEPHHPRSEGHSCVPTRSRHRPHQRIEAR